QTCALPICGTATATGAPSTVAPSAARPVRGWWGRSWGGGLLLESGLTHRLCDHLADATVILTGPSHLCVAGAPLAAVAAAPARGLRAIGVGTSGEHHSPSPPWESRAAWMRRAASATGANG